MKKIVLFLSCLTLLHASPAAAKSYKLSETPANAELGRSSTSSAMTACTDNSGCAGTTICSNGVCRDICVIRNCPKSQPTCSGKRTGSTVSYTCSCATSPDSCPAGQRCNSTTGACENCPKGDDCGCFSDGLGASGKGSCGDLECERFDAATGKCVSCRDGYYLTLNKTCAKCSSVIKGCHTCQATNGANVVCKSCKYSEDENEGKGTHYTLIGKGTDAECVACSGDKGIAGCSVCSQTEFNCLACNNNFSLYQNACTASSAIVGNMGQIEANLAPKAVCVSNSNSCTNGQRYHSVYKVCMNCAYGSKCNCTTGKWADGTGGCTCQEAVQYVCKNGVNTVQQYYTSSTKGCQNGCPKCPEGTIDYVTHYVENGATSECAGADGGLGTATALVCSASNGWSAFCCRVGRKICKKDGSVCTEASPKGCISSSNVPASTCPVSI